MTLSAHTRLAMAVAVGLIVIAASDIVQARVLIEDVACTRPTACACELGVRYAVKFRYGQKCVGRHSVHAAVTRRV